MNQALWFASRSCGQVSLLLLTLVAVLGALHTGRAATRRWPRFAVHTLHHNLAVLAVAFVALHVATAIIDPYAGIRWRMPWCPSRRPTNPSGPGWARPRQTCCWPSW